jgi:pectinesterase
MIVAKDGSGDFLTVQEAVDSVENDTHETVIHVRKGTYKEKIHINKANVTIVGEDVNETILTYDDYANKLFEDGRNYGTFNSYSLMVIGSNFKASDITIANTAGLGNIVGQAVAAYVDADMVYFENCRFLGNQDTLFTGPLPPKPMAGGKFGSPVEDKPKIPGRQYYKNCYIEGDIDFIFGSATAVFENCEIFSFDRNKDVNGYVTAASTQEGEAYGYVFLDCKLTSDAKPGTVYLGRPWRNFAKTVFINCEMEAHIKEEGWHNWNKPEAEGTILFGEFGSKGTGANSQKRAGFVKILKEVDLTEYTLDKIFKGWRP